MIVGNPKLLRTNYESKVDTAMFCFRELHFLLLGIFDWGYARIKLYWYLEIRYEYGNYSADTCYKIVCLSGGG